MYRLQRTGFVKINTWMMTPSEQTYLLLNSLIVFLTVL